MSQLTITHVFVSTVSDSTSSPEKVQPSHWNSSHTVSVSTLSVLPGRFQRDFVSGYIPAPTSGSVPLLINAPYAGQIDLTTTISSAGTGTLTFTINGSSIGGTANAISTTENAQSHSTGNSFSSGDDVAMTVSSPSSLAGLAFTMAYLFSLTSSTA